MWSIQRECHNRVDFQRCEEEGDECVMKCATKQSGIDFGASQLTFSRCRNSSCHFNTIYWTCSWLLMATLYKGYPHFSVLVGAEVFRGWWSFLEYIYHHVYVVNNCSDETIVDVITVIYKARSIHPQAGLDIFGVTASSSIIWYVWRFLMPWYLPVLMPKRNHSFNQCHY